MVTFNSEEFKTLYPEFKTLEDSTLELYFKAACLLLDNSCASLVKDLEERKLLLYMLICHIATLKANGNTLVGNITSASEGKVSVSVTPFANNAKWYGATQCGTMFWQATAKYRIGVRYNAYRHI